MHAFPGAARSVFFSSRRRHTRCSRDWSSDVCSSDLLARVALEFIEASAFDVFEGHSRELEGFAGEVVDRRLDAVRDFAYADPYAERQRLQPGAQVQKQGGERRQLFGKGLKFIAGGYAVRQANTLLAQMFFRSSRELFAQQIGRASCRGKCRSRWSPDH